ncbi:MAG: hypothetical protein WCL39_01015, partial [Armatimonadota bacterium]
MRRAIIILILMAAVMAGSSKNAQTAPDIWGATIMKQPSDTQPFQQINIPEWVQDLRSITYCFSANGVYGPTWDWRRDAAKAGAQMSEMAFISQETGALYDSQLIKGRDPRWQEYLQKEIPAYKKMGVKILAGFPPGLMGECYYAHPDWRMITENTTAIPSADPIKDPGGGGLCEMGPWGDYMIEILAEMATKYPDIAAFTFDGICHRTACYCQHCRVAYRKDTGLEIPNRDMSDSNYRHYLHWLDRRMESVIQRMQTRLKGINPKLSVITWTTNAGRYGHLMSVPRNMPARMNLLFDAPDQEFWMDETNRGNTVVAAFGNAYMWAVSNHRVAFSNPYMMTHGNPYGQDSLTAEETMRRHLLVLTFGPRPNAGIAGSTTYVHTVFKMMGEVEKRWPWCKKREFEPWAAMVMSDNTNTFYGRDGRTEERYLANVLGTFRAGLESHLPLTVINDWNLTPQDLAKFKVLVLPNTAVMGDAQAEAVRQFVKNGGGLVASMDTSLFD